MKNKNIKLSTKISLTFGAVIFTISITILLFINITVQNSMKEQPIIKSATANTISITFNKDMKNELSYYLPISSEEFMEQMKNTENDTGYLEQLLQAEVLGRILRYSFIAAIFVGFITFILSNRIANSLMKPLTRMVKVTQSITLNNLEERIELPAANNETSALIDAFNKTLDRLKGVFAALDEFNAYASHELRNSLAILRACIEGMDCNKNGGVNKKMALEYVTKLTRTVEDVMAISSRQLKDKGEHVDLALLAAQAADEYLLTGRKINLNIPEEGVRSVYGKELWLQRVICNLLDNAVKNSDKDSEITINIRQHQDAVILEVKDEGAGIEEADLDSIWMPYYSKSQSGRKGTGLGLAMVYHVINTFGGLVWVESRVSEGTSFYVSLPAINAS